MNSAPTTGPLAGLTLTMLGFVADAARAQFCPLSTHLSSTWGSLPAIRSCHSQLERLLLYAEPTLQESSPHLMTDQTGRVNTLLPPSQGDNTEAS